MTSMKFLVANASQSGVDFNVFNIDGSLCTSSIPRFDVPLRTPKQFLTPVDNNKIYIFGGRAYNRTNITSIKLLFEWHNYFYDN